MNDLEGALQDFSKEVEIRPTHIMGFVNRAAVYGSMKNYRAAIDDISHLIATDATWSQGYILRSNYYYMAGKKDSACADIKIAKMMRHPQAEQLDKQYCK
jgi:tetratricopeptide (TPR) repeat protein